MTKENAYLRLWFAIFYRNPDLREIGADDNQCQPHKRWCLEQAAFCDAACRKFEGSAIERNEIYTQRPADHHEDKPQKMRDEIGFDFLPHGEQD